MVSSDSILAETSSSFLLFCSSTDISAAPDSNLVENMENRIKHHRMQEMGKLNTDITDLTGTLDIVIINITILHANVSTHLLFAAFTSFILFLIGSSSLIVDYLVELSFFIIAGSFAPVGSISFTVPVVQTLSESVSIDAIVVVLGILSTS